MIEYATVERTSAGPKLHIGTVCVRSWLGVRHNPEAYQLASDINLALEKMTWVDGTREVPEEVTDRVCYSIDRDNYNRALNMLIESHSPRVVFKEDIDEMRLEAREISKRDIWEAINILKRLINEE